LENALRGKRQLVSYVGVFLLFIGVFLPIMKVPILGSVDYFRDGEGDGVIVLLFSLISLGLIYLKRYKWLMYTGIASLIVIAVTFINITVKMSEMKSELQSDLEGNPFGFVGDAMLESVSYSWGWLVLVLGAGLLIYASISSKFDDEVEQVEGKVEEVDKKVESEVEEENKQ
jgi:hypothetical protein